MFDTRHLQSAGSIKKLIGGCAVIEHNPERKTESQDNALIANLTIGRLYKILDSNTNIEFLVDSGASISLIPKRLLPRHCKLMPLKASISLVAANKLPIKIFGKTNLKIEINHRDFSWNFLVAEVSTPILGADFLGHFNFMIDVNKRRLIQTNLIAVSTNSNIPAPYSKLLDKYPLVTSSLGSTATNITTGHKAQHFIETTGPPCHARARRLNTIKLEQAKLEIKKLRDAGILRPSSSPFASPMHMVKKRDGSWRICGDYRHLNSITKRDSYPLPNIQDLISSLTDKKIFSKIDLAKAYHQIPMEESAIPKTALITPFGLFEYCRMSFGLKNASQTFQRFMDEVTRGLADVYVYVDDILVASENEVVHMNSLKCLLQRLVDHGLVMNTEKCEFGLHEIDFLGYHITKNGCLPAKYKLDQISRFTEPSGSDQLQKFLGMSTYYCRFVKNFATIASPLYDLLKKDSEFIWTKMHSNAFQKLKDELQKNVMLCFPDMTKPISIASDASQLAIGAVLQQLVKDTWLPIAFYSKRLMPSQTRYSTFDRELLAAKEAVKHFRHFIEGIDFILFTDHRPLVQAMSSKEQRNWTPRQERQISYISEFTSNLQYVKGTDNSVADCLSRNIDSVQTHLVDYKQFFEEQQKDEFLSTIPEAASQLKKMQYGGYNLLCDISHGKIRPIVPKTMERLITELFHSWAHPGAKTTLKLIKDCYVWKHMSSYIANYVRCCEECQRAKVQRHCRHPIRKFRTPSGRFKDIHADIVGPLPTDRGYRYLFTMIDRFTRWFEAVPMVDITTETCAEAMLTGWIARFGTPESLVTDRGRQFESKLWKSIGLRLGFQTPTTTAYHPQSNGLVERLHRTLKASLMARLKGKRTWLKELPIALMGLRACIKTDTNVTPAELLYGENIRLPGDMVNGQEASLNEEPSFLKVLRKSMSSCLYTPPKRHGVQESYLPKSLSNASHVFVREDSIKAPLTRPYNGPFEVIARNKDYYTIVGNDGHKNNVSIDRLKPAFFLPRGR